MSDEERQQRSASNSNARRAWWQSLSAEERAAFIEKGAEGRRRSLTRGDTLARSKYRRAGLPDDEIDLLMSMSQADRKWARKRFVLYGVRPLDVEAMRTAQGGLCGLCFRSLPKVFHIDHDHDSGKVRGLLCAKCNLALGHVEARGPEWVSRAQAWIRSPRLSSQDL